ncbi:hypothetical protein AB0M02_00335 [Actinoplanes sp. NPDC051861]|uniref:hypothetical protein n=1 Tax=Actinoplanes sp. NPDC051861 TaxID=3155170 RepID=UPI00343A4C96
MIQHPHQLHAQAALWSLRRALRHLHDNRDTFLARRPQLGPSTSRPRSLASLQRHDARLLEEKPDRIRLAGSKAGATSAPGDVPGLSDLEREVNQALVEAHGLLAYHHHRDPLLAWSGHWRQLLDEWGVRRDARWTWLSTVLPVTRPKIAQAVGITLADADARVRAYARLDEDLVVPPYVPPCPACDRRRLRIQTSAPDSARWTIVCAPSCICAGERCIPCGEECEADCEGHACSMDVPTHGVRHIWAADSPLAASIRAGVQIVGLAA